LRERRNLALTAGWYRTIRLSLWLAAVVIALLPAIFKAMDSAVLDVQLLRDFIFVVIPASALGLSGVLDYLCMNYQVLSGSKFALSILSIIFNIFGMMSGLVGFLVLPSGNLPATQRQLWTFSVLNRPESS
jgi:hypothetical protein